MKVAETTVSSANRDAERPLGRRPHTTKQHPAAESKEHHG